MSLHSKQSLYERLADRKFREAFVSSRIAQTIATQIRVLRQREEMSQKDLARALVTSQNAISRLESPKYGKLSISTLKKIASVFDVGLVVRFSPFSEVVDWTTKLSEQSISVPSFASDTGFIERRSPASDDLRGVSARVNGTNDSVALGLGASTEKTRTNPPVRSANWRLNMAMPKSTVCEVRRNGRWERQTVSDAVRMRDRGVREQRRCVECHWSVKPHKKAKNGAEAHFEHHPDWNPKCPLRDRSYGRK